jgi:hypothetical protein
MANVPSRWLEYKPSNVSELRELIRTLVHSKGQKQDYFAAVAVWDRGDFSRWLNGHEGANLSDTRYYKLLHHLGERDWLVPENYDQVFSGISKFFEFPAEELLARYADFEGDYVVYRYSLLAPGCILRGKLNIRYDQDLKALKTTEYHRIQAELIVRIKNKDTRAVDADPKWKVDDMEFHRVGYFFARSLDSYIMISKKLRESDHEPVELQIVNFENIYPASRKPGQLRGFLSDWHGREFYTTRVVAQKLEEPLDDKDVKTLDKEMVPDIVVTHLGKRIEQDKNVVWFT